MLTVDDEEEESKEEKKERVPVAAAEVAAPGYKVNVAAADDNYQYPITPLANLYVSPRISKT